MDLRNLAIAIQLECVYATLHALFGPWLVSREDFPECFEKWIVR